MKNGLQYPLDLITVLVQKEFKARYKNNFLGYLWSIGNPLAFAAVFYIAFKVIMKIQMEDYPLFIITGLFPWQWFYNSISSSSVVFLRNTSLIKKVSFQRNFLPLSATINDMLHFLLSIPVILLLLLIYGRPLFLSYVYGIPLLLAIQLLLTYGLCLLFSCLTLFFRDLERLTLIFLMILFYFTPIIYPESMIPPAYHHFIYLNPQALIIVNWRHLFYDGTLVPSYLLVSLAYGIVSWLIGQAVYNKLSWKFAEIV